MWSPRTPGPGSPWKLGPKVSARPQKSAPKVSARPQKMNDGPKCLPAPDRPARRPTPLLKNTPTISRGNLPYLYFSNLVIHFYLYLLCFHCFIIYFYSLFKGSSRSTSLVLFLRPTKYISRSSARHASGFILCTFTNNLSSFLCKNWSSLPV